MGTAREERASSEVMRLFRSGAGGATLASWPRSSPEARDAARSVLEAVVEATGREVAWGPIEAFGEDSLEHALGDLVAVSARARGSVLRVAARVIDRGTTQAVDVHALVAPGVEILPDHPEIVRALIAARAHVRALVERAAFGRGTAEDLAGLDGVRVVPLGSRAAFERRVLQDDEREDDVAHGRIEAALGALRGIELARADAPRWGEAIARALAPIEGLVASRLDAPWSEELLLDLKLVLVARTFPSSGDEEAEALRPFVARLERVLAAGGVVVDVHGPDLATAELVASPGPHAG